MDPRRTNTPEEKTNQACHPKVFFIARPDNDKENTTAFKGAVFDGWSDRNRWSDRKNHQIKHTYIYITQPLDRWYMLIGVRYQPNVFDVFAKGIEQLSKTSGWRFQLTRNT